MNCFLGEPISHSSAAWASQEDYRSALVGLHVSVPESGAIDFRAVALAADSVHNLTSGRVSARAFLVKRREELDGRAPIDVIVDPDGPERIRRLADAVTSEFAR